MRIDVKGMRCFRGDCDRAATHYARGELYCDAHAQEETESYIMRHFDRRAFRYDRERGCVVRFPTSVSAANDLGQAPLTGAENRTRK